MTNLEKHDQLNSIDLSKFCICREAYEERERLKAMRLHLLEGRAALSDIAAPSPAGQLLQQEAQQAPLHQEQQHMQPEQPHQQQPGACLRRKLQHTH